MNKYLAQTVGYSDDDLRARFEKVDTWVFDLDNTLYSPDSDLWPKIERRITHFLADRLDLDGLSARALQKYYYQKFGTTLRGLASEEAITPDEFLTFVHDIDRSTLAPNPALSREIRALPGRKFVFTNGSRDHALLTTAQLGLEDAFDGLFDIVDSNLAPKPDAAAYHAFFARYSISPTSSAMFEDIAKNLIVPKGAGMISTLVVTSPGQADHRDGDDREFVDLSVVDFVTSDLTAFLRSINGIRI